MLDADIVMILNDFTVGTLFSIPKSIQQRSPGGSTIYCRTEAIGSMPVLQIIIIIIIIFVY